MAVYELVSQIGPMGTERVTDNWRRLFKSLTSAKKYAEADYKKKSPTETFNWIGENNHWRSPDLHYVIYVIRKVTVYA